MGNFLRKRMKPLAGLLSALMVINFLAPMVRRTARAAGENNQYHPSTAVIKLEELIPYELNKHNNLEKNGSSQKAWELKI